MPEGTGELEELYVVIGIDSDGNEGVVSYTTPDGVMRPALGGPHREKELRAVAQALANVSGIPLCFTKWVKSDVLELIAPEGASERQGSKG
jgi:hypothetical protein